MQLTITKKKKKEIACARLRNIRPVIIKQCVDRIKAIPIHKHARTLRADGVGGEVVRHVGRKSEREHTHFVSFCLRTPIDGIKIESESCVHIHPLSDVYVAATPNEIWSKCVCVRGTSKRGYHIIISFVPLIGDRSRCARCVRRSGGFPTRTRRRRRRHHRWAAAAAAVDAAAASHHRRRRALPMEMPRARTFLWCSGVLYYDVIFFILLVCD